MALSQMMSHYLSVKERYQDCVIFYRLGDFYEMFFDDAIKVSSLLDLTLTGRDCGLSERAPMCGVPFHSADSYIAKLVNLGEKVAICEQLSEPKPGKAMVERDVVRVVSSGTVTDENYLDEKKSNYIACAFAGEQNIGVAWADITTGEFKATTFSGESAVSDFIAQLLKLGVSEVLANDEAVMKTKDCIELTRGMLPRFSNYLPWAFNLRHAENNLKQQFAAASLSAYNLSGHDEAISAAGALVEYLNETQKHALKILNGIQYVKNDEYMVLDPIAIRNLELVRTNHENKRYGSLLWLLDKTKTGMGARLLADFIVNPLCDKGAIEYRQDGVEELCAAPVVRMGICDTLKTLKDVERLTGKISNGNLTPRDCLALAKSLECVPALKIQLSGFTSGILSSVRSDLVDMSMTAELLNMAIDEEAPALLKDGGYIRRGYNEELDNLRMVKANARSIMADMEADERETTGIKTLKIGYNRVFGYYIEVTNSFKDKVPQHYIRKQTLTTGERFITEGLKDLEERILTSEDRALKIESQLYNELKDILSEQIPALKKISHAIALLDVITAFATVAQENRYVRPRIVGAEEAMEITESRHPVVEAVSKEKFIPNDVLLDCNENRTLVITGPNMAGKSTYMRQVALIVLMAHLGSFVPAKSAVIPVTDRIFTRIGASDNLILDQSTFMVEMTEVANILRNATAGSLLVLDEVGRGTSTYDGLSIAWAVIEYITQNCRAKTLFSTHYHELTQLEGKIEGVKNYKVTVREYNGAVVFLRKIVRGGASKSFGIEVASLAGVPKEVTRRAKGILKQLEKNSIGQKEVSEMHEGKKPRSKVESVLADLKIETLTPMQAMLLLSDLAEQVKEEENG